jgi:hypothetical protein
VLRGPQPPGARRDVLRARSAHREYAGLVSDLTAGARAAAAAETFASFRSQLSLGGAAFAGLFTAAALGYAVGVSLYGQGDARALGVAVGFAIVLLLAETGLLVIQLSRADAVAGTPPHAHSRRASASGPRSPRATSARFKPRSAAAPSTSGGPRATAAASAASSAASGAAVGGGEGGLGDASGARRAAASGCPSASVNAMGILVSLELLSSPAKQGVSTKLASERGRACLTPDERDDNRDYLQTQPMAAPASATAEGLRIALGQATSRADAAEAALAGVTAALAAAVTRAGEAEARAVAAEARAAVAEAELATRLHAFVDRLLPAAGHAIFEYLTTRDAVEVRAVNRACRDAVAGHRWHDLETHIRRDVRGWRACFPRASGADFSGPDFWAITWLTDADFVHLRGLTELQMARCVNVTDAAFVHLRGIHTLDMLGCNQATITDAAFVHLAGIRTLYMSGCSQRTITDAAFAHLRGIHTLDMSNCNQDTITDAAFAHLAGIHTLHMNNCHQHTIADAAFSHLRGIHTLGMSNCNQDTITDAAFAHLAGIHTLHMNNCHQHTITDAAFAHLRGIHMLDMAGCDQPTITIATREWAKAAMPALWDAA